VILGVCAALLLLGGGGVTGGIYLLTRGSANSRQAGLDGPQKPRPEREKDKGQGNPPDQTKDKDRAAPDDGPPKDLRSALVMLHDVKPERRRAAVAFLDAAPVEPSRSEEVARHLEARLDDPDLREDVEKALDRWAPSGKLGRLNRQLQEGDEDACARAMDRLSRMDDDAAAEALAGQLKGRSHLAVKYLPRTGKRCEKHVLAFYNDPVDARRENARKVLDAIGTGNDPRVRQCLTDLEQTEKLPDAKDPNHTAARLRRASAVETLGKLKPPQDREVGERVSQRLGEMLDDKDGYLVGLAAKALEAGWSAKGKAPEDKARQDK
jgi:hypothetical protein